MSFLRYITKAKVFRVQSILDDIKTKRDPAFFEPTGTQVYCGRQGSGKTISAVEHFRAIKKDYPACILVSNLDLFEFNVVTFNDENELQTELASPQFNPSSDYIFFENVEQLEIALTKINNGMKGVMYVVDEIHTYFNSLESKNIPPHIFTEISQQRKQRKLIIGTSQLFLRMAKPFREQCDNMINCFTLFNALTMQFAYDGMSVGDDNRGRLRLDGNLKKIGWFWHTRKTRQAFDTFQKVVSAAVQYDETINIRLSKKERKFFGKGK